MSVQPLLRADLLQVWTLGLCVCWSASRRCRAADQLRDLKEPNRLVITANHNGRGMYSEGGAYRWRSAWRGETQGDHIPTAKPQQAFKDHHKMFWQYFSFRPEGIGSVGKHNTETRCCLWVKSVNANCLAWVAAVWLSKENKNAPPLQCRPELFEHLYHRPKRLKERAVYRWKCTYADKMLKDYEVHLGTHSSRLQLSRTFLGIVSFSSTWTVT